VAVVAAGSRNTHCRVARYGLLGPVFHRLDCASHTGAFGYAVPTIITCPERKRGKIPGDCCFFGILRGSEV